MRKLLWGLVPLFIAQMASAHHLTPRNASLLANGTVPLARLDPSVTIQGVISVARPFTVILGTPGAIGADIVSQTQEGFIAACATAVARGGGTVRVLDGNYNLARVVFVASNVVIDLSAGAVVGGDQIVEQVVKLEGTWRGGVIISTGLTDTATSFFLLQGSASDGDVGATIEDVKFVGGKIPSNQESYFVKFAGKGGTIRRCLFTQNLLVGSAPSFIGISSITAHDTSIQDCRFISNNGATGGDGGQDIYLGNQTTGTVTIDRCLFDNQQNAGNSNTTNIQINRSSNTIISNCIFDRRRSNGSAAIYMFPTNPQDISGVALINNSFIGGTDPVLIQPQAVVDGIRNLLISGNRFMNCTTDCIKTFRTVGSGTAINALIHGNHAFGVATFLSEDASATSYHHRDNMVNGTMATDD